MNTCTRTLAVAAVFLTAAAPLPESNAAIAYSSGPGFSFETVESEPLGGTLDLNADGIIDFNLLFGYFICTADIPVSACTSSFFVYPSETNAVLSRPGYAMMLPFRSSISPIVVSNSAWSLTEYGATVSSYFFSARYATRGYYGPLTDSGVAYVGVRFHAEDGLHYGWVRLATPESNVFAPRVIDWAYETRPDTAIPAGAIGPAPTADQFLVTFESANGIPDESLGAGSLILNGNTLRCEVTLNGAFSSAVLTGPAGAAQAHAVDTLGTPLAKRSNYTSFFRDVTLSHGELLQFMRGNIRVTIDGGRLTGRLSPLP